MNSKYISRQARLLLISDEVDSLETDEIDLLKILCGLKLYSSHGILFVLKNDQENSYFWWSANSNVIFYSDEILKRINPISLKHFDDCVFQIFKKLNLTFNKCKYVRY